MSYSIRVFEIPKINLLPQSQIEEVLQNVALLVSTRKGTVPYDREFGLEQAFLDKPMGLAQTIFAKEVFEALTQFEPRASVSDISFEYDETCPGRLQPILKIEVNLDGE